MPLQKWIFVIYLLTAGNKDYVSSTKLSESIGVTQKTAWFMLQKVHQAIDSHFFDNALDVEST